MVHSPTQYSDIFARGGRGQPADFKLTSDGRMSYGVDSQEKFTLRGGKAYLRPPTRKRVEAKRSVIRFFFPVGGFFSQNPETVSKTDTRRGLPRASRVICPYHIRTRA